MTITKRFLRLAIAILFGITLVGPMQAAAGQTPPKTAAPAQAGDEKWKGGFPLNDTNGDILTTLVLDGFLYAGGSFTQIGGIHANHIARYHIDQGYWEPLGTTQANGTDGEVYSLASDINGTSRTLYLGGVFNNIKWTGQVSSSTSAIGVAAYNVTARTWSGLGSGLDTVRALAVDSAHVLYAGGDFSNSGSVTLHHVAYWKNNTWNALGNGVNGQVEALAIDTGLKILYVGGSFGFAGSSIPLTGGLAVWDIAAPGWSAAGALGPQFDSNHVTTFAFDQFSHILYVGGSFNQPSGAENLSMFNGLTKIWSSTSASTDGRINAMAFDQVNFALYVGGSFNIISMNVFNNVIQLKGNGATLAALGAGSENGVNTAVTALAISADGQRVFTGGYFTLAGSQPVTHLAEWYWTKSGWYALGPGNGLGPQDKVDSTHPAARAILADGSKVFYAGDFTAAGGINANHVAVWDAAAQTWSPLVGSGGNGVDGPVYAMALDPATHDLYLGGNFAHAGGLVAQFVARWSQTNKTWSVLNAASPNGAVLALVWAGDHLVAGGSFTQIGANANLNRVAAYTGGAWQVLGTGIHDHEVKALAFDSTLGLVAGGDFQTNYPHLAFWDGASWQAIGVGVDGPVYALTISAAHTLYVGGAFTHSGTVLMLNVASFTYGASNGQPLGVGVNGSVFSLVADGQTVYAGGNFTIATHDLVNAIPPVTVNRIASWSTTDNKWSALASGFSADVNAMVKGGGALYAGGVFNQSGAATQLFNGAAVWNNVDRWTALGAGKGVNDSVQALASTDTLDPCVYVGGQFSLAGDVIATGIACYNPLAGTWSPLGRPAFNLAVRAIALDPSANSTVVYVGGGFSSASGVANTQYLARWDAAAGWQAVGTGIGDIVNAMAYDSNSHSLYAGGFFDNAAGVPGTDHIARWGGGAWHELAGGLNHVVNALALDSNHRLYAGGFFTGDNTALTAHHVAMWSPTSGSWSALAAGGVEGVDDTVFSLAANDQGLYVGGNFLNSAAGSLKMSHIARWTPASAGVSAGWSQLAQGGVEGVATSNPWGFVHALTASQNRVYAGGNFLNEGDLDTQNVGLWNGAHWMSLGSGVDGYTSEVYALTVDQSGTLYVGGYFLSTSGHSSPYLAMYSNDIPHFAANPLSLSPNPAETYSPATLSGAFLDADISDTHTVNIAWGDGSADTALNLAAGVLTFTANHTYTHRPVAPATQFTIDVMVVDASQTMGDTTLAIGVANHTIYLPAVNR